VKTVLWTKHAVNEASKFNLNQEYCHQIISDPDNVINEGKVKRRYIRFKRKKLIAVICEEQDYAIIIKTIDVTTRR